MDSKVLFFLLLVLLIILMLFYYIDLESNIIILLGVVIILIIHNIITKKEHFIDNSLSARMHAQIDTLLGVANAVKHGTPDKHQQSTTPEQITIESSCPFVIIDKNNAQDDNLSPTPNQKYLKIGTVDLGKFTPEDLSAILKT